MDVHKDALNAGSTQGSFLPHMGFAPTIEAGASGRVTFPISGGV